MKRALPEDPGLLDDELELRHVAWRQYLKESRIKLPPDMLERLKKERRRQREGIQ